MKYIYSAKNNAFCPVDWKQSYLEAGSWPDDGIAVSDDVFNQFGSEPPVGKMRIAGADGFPSWGDIPPPTVAQYQQQAEIQKRQLLHIANEKIAIYQDAVDLGIATQSEKNLLTTWRKYRVILNRTNCTLAPDIPWPEQPE